VRTVVCLCGSTRFSEEYQKANLCETLAGNIVLTIGCDMKSDNALFAGKSEQELETIKKNLDSLHFAKIEMAWEILVLNVDGYIGQSTRREIEYAMTRRKGIRWLEPQWVVTTEPIEWYEWTMPKDALGVLHPDSANMIHYPMYPDPVWRGFQKSSHDYISAFYSDVIFPTRDLWLSECRADWLRQHNQAR
jgi:hypothetical protein